MSWYKGISDHLLKRACSFLLHRYLGQFLNERVSIEQLSVDVFTGRGSISDVQINSDYVNDCLDAASLPFCLIDGYIGAVSVQVPWTRLLDDSCALCVEKLEITLQPKSRATADLVASMFESMIGSMTTSMELAKSVLSEESTKDKACGNVADGFDGVEAFAQVIDTVLSRLKVRFEQVVVRLEHFHDDSRMGTAIEFRIERIEYFDDILNNAPSSQESSSSSMPPSTQSSAIPQSRGCVLKKLRLRGVQLFTDIFSRPENALMTSMVVRRQARNNQGACSQPLTQQLLPEFCSVYAESSSSVFQSCINSSQLLLPSAGAHLGAELGCSPSAPKVASCPVPFLAFSADASSQQDLIVSVMVSNADNVKPGATNVKVEASVYFGKACGILCATQLRLVLDLLEALLSGSGEKSSAKGSDTPLKGKPMLANDFKMVETALHNQLLSPRCQTAQLWGRDFSEGNWSGEETYYSLDKPSLSNKSRCSDGSLSSQTRITQASLDTFNDDSDKDEFTSIHFSSTEEGSSAPDLLKSTGKGKRLPPSKHSTNQQPRKLSRGSNEKTTTEVTRCKIHLSSVCLLLTYDDPLSNSAMSIDEAVRQLSQSAEHFFANVRTTMAARAGPNFQLLRRTLSATEPRDHLLFLSNTFVVDHTEQRCGASNGSLKLKLSIGNCELTECLESNTRNLEGSDTPGATHNELLTFFGDFVPSEPNLVINISGENGALAVSAILGACQSQFDISIIDRLYNLIHCKPIYAENLRNAGALASAKLFSVPVLRDDIFNDAPSGNGASSSLSLPFDLYAKNLTLDLRFPLADLNPLEKRLPWWKQHVREEVLRLQFSEAKVSLTIRASLSDCGVVNVSASSLTGFFCKNSSDAVPAKFLYATKLADVLCSVSVKWNNVPGSLFADASAGPCSFEAPTSESNGFFRVDRKECSGPFSRKFVAHESEQLTRIGTREELQEFSKSCLQSTDIFVKITLPSLNLHLPGKAFYELLYNRFVNDLCMWTPSNPGSKIAQINASNHYNVQLLRDDQFLPCRSTIRRGGYDSESSDEGTSNGEEEHEASNGRKLPNGFVLKMNCDSAKVCIDAPLLEHEGGSRLVFHADHGELFLVTAFEGSKDVQYFYLTQRNVSAFQGFSDGSGGFSGADCDSELFAAIDDKLKCVAEPTPTGLRLTAADEDNFGVAFKVNKLPKEGLKKFTLALGICNTTLHARLSSWSDVWIKQLIDFFDVVDYPVLGYKPARVITELHLHCGHCAIQYKPDDLPVVLRACLGSLDLSTNIVSKANALRLHFLVEEFVLFLGDRSKLPASGAFRLLSDLVCIAQMGFFDLTVTHVDWDGTAPLRVPAIDVRASNNRLDFRLCPDSFALFVLLVNHLVGGQSEPETAVEGTEAIGDESAEPFSKAQGATMTSPSPLASNRASSASLATAAPPCQRRASMDSVHDDVISSPETSKTIEDRISGLMEDAMNDPHDLAGCRSDSLLSTSPATSVGSKPRSACNTDDEFCIIENTIGSGVKTKSGEPRILIPDDKPVRVVDGFLTGSVQRSDILMALPAGYPVPAIRVQIRDVSVSFSLYGGHDFGPEAIPTKAYSGWKKPSPAIRSRFTTARKNVLTHGGPGRDHSVLVEADFSKLCYLNEVYPLGHAQTSRHVLTIQDVTIRDRLVQSQINKLLYQYATDKKPRQTYQPIVCIKLLTCQPEVERQSRFAADCCAKVSMLPLCLNVDQDTLDFLQDFSAEVSASLVASEALKQQDRKSTAAANVTITRVSESKLSMDECAEDRRSTVDLVVERREELEISEEPPFAAAAVGVAQQGLKARLHAAEANLAPNLNANGQPRSDFVHSSSGGHVALRGCVSIDTRSEMVIPSPTVEDELMSPPAKLPSLLSRSIMEQSIYQQRPFGGVSPHGEEEEEEDDEAIGDLGFDDDANANALLEAAAKNVSDDDDSSSEFGLSSSALQRECENVCSEIQSSCANDVMRAVPSTVASSVPFASASSNQTKGGSAFAPGTQAMVAMTKKSSDTELTSSITIERSFRTAVPNKPEASPRTTRNASFVSTQQVRFSKRKSEEIESESEQSEQQRQHALDKTGTNDKSELIDMKCPIHLELLEPTPVVPILMLAHGDSADSGQLYFKTFIFAPEVMIKLDYHGKRVSFDEGALQGLLFGLSQLHHTELRLKELHCKQGFLGFQRVLNYALNEWLNDVRKNQLSNILGGVGPMYCLVQVARGIRDLFYLPVEEYRRDGHVVKGLQRGAESFTLSTATAALELTQQVVGTVQVGLSPTYLIVNAFLWFLIPFWIERLLVKGLAEFAFDIVNPNYPPRLPSDPWQAFQQPADLREGLAMACRTVKMGIVDTASAVSCAAQEERLHGRWAVRGVLRQLTPAALRPLVAITQATGHIIGGLRNQIRPDARREDLEKWKVPE